jgi:hypothetical protein
MAKTNNKELKYATSAESSVKPALVSNSNTWTGTLVNRDCFKRSDSVKGCAATTSTNRFMIIDKQGKQYRFDSAMNERTRWAMQARASRSNPFRTTRTPVYASANAEMIRLR